MLVKELIERLKMCNQEAQVLTSCGGWTYSTVYELSPVFVRTRVNVFDEEEIVDDNSPVVTSTPNGIFLDVC